MTATLQVSQLLLLPLSSNSKHPIILKRSTHKFSHSKLSSSLCPLPHHLATFSRVHNFSGVWRARSKEIVRAVAGASATMGAQTLSGRFAELKKSGEVALIPFVVAGDPDLATTEAVLLALDANGADIIELGVPYSDPLADGPVIQAAAARALTRGTDLASVLTLVAKVTPNLRAPLVLFTYYNPIMKRGPANFFRIVKEAGVAGLVVPDIPLEESGPLRELGSQYGLELVLLTTPTTPVKRMKVIAQASQGFLYLVSLTGVTGAKAAVEGRVEQLLADIKKSTDKPVAVGFGISEPAHAFQVASWGADGVIVGSALVRLLFEAPSPEAGVEDVVKLIRELKEAISKKALNR